MNLHHSELERSAVRLGKELERQGYAVVFTPSPDHFPFSLEGYTPDLLASKRDRHLIVEIKSRDSPGAARQMKRVAEIVERQPGWDLLLQTMDDRGPSPCGACDAALPSVSAIEEHLSKARRVLAEGFAELAIPFLWNAAAGLLRIKAAEEGIDHAELSDVSLVNRLYSMGMVSHADRQALLEWHGMRNAAVHSVAFEADAAAAHRLSAYTQDLLGTLKTKGNAGAISSGAG